MQPTIVRWFFGSPIRFYHARRSDPRIGARIEAVAFCRVKPWSTTAAMLWLLFRTFPPQVADWP
jgi:hypothetical protein